jgi:hypothetical protein
VSHTEFLQFCISSPLGGNENQIDFNKLLPHVVTIADAQFKQQVLCFLPGDDAEKRDNEVPRNLTRMPELLPIA